MAPDAAAPARTASLGARVHSDYEALQNDVAQARELAGDFQRQLAGKTNEFAQLKQVFEKTASDLVRLEKGLEELRAERHRLANEAMRAAGFELRLAKVTSERDQLRAELEAARDLFTRGRDELARAVHERDKEIAALAIELAGAREAAGNPCTGSCHEPRSKRDVPKAASRGASEEFIDISFSA